MGLDVVCVVSGAAAARSLATRHVDLIVTETGLADTDGFTLVHWLRRSPAYRETPVILLRSRIGMLDPARAWLDGRMTLLGKPVTRGGLARLCARQHGRDHDPAGVTRAARAAPATRAARAIDRHSTTASPASRLPCDPVA